MNILLIGAHGQLGTALSGVLPPHAVRWGRGDLDLERGEEIRAKVTAVQPEIIINTAAMTAVDACELNPTLAQRINAEAPRRMALVCKEMGALLVHVSTDYVFGADETRHAPYTESDRTGPVNVYGQSKLEGESAIQQSGCEYLIVRTSGLYGGAVAQQNYVRTVIERARQGGVLRATVDQCYSPTFVDEFAAVLWRVVQGGTRGLIHLVNTLPVSRYEFTKAIVDLCTLPVTVAPAQRQDFAGAPRPAYTVLGSERIELTHVMHSWKDALQHYVSRLLL